MPLLKQADSSIEGILAYWIRERMDIFWARVAGDSPPYSTNPIFQQYRFTSVYRASDRVTQYLIRNVQYNADWSPEDLIFRTILFKHFNTCHTWDGLKIGLGEEPSLSNFSFDRYCQALDYVAETYSTVYNNAYMTAWVRDSYKQKHYGYLKLFEDVFRDGIISRLLDCKSLPELYATVLTMPYIGDFLAYQYTVDLNYSPIWKFDENDLAMATVGSKRGIEKLLGRKPGSYGDIIRFYVEYQENLLDTYGLYDGWVNLFGRRLHNIDVQNCFCELDKFCREAVPDLKTGNAAGKRIKTKFRRTSQPYRLMFPDWWAISRYNDLYEVT